MKTIKKSERATLSCPSAPATAEGAEVFGVVVGTVEAPRVEYLSEPLPVTAELLSGLGESRAGEVLRVRASCAKSACVHFSESHCRLGEQIAALPPPSAARSRLPPCTIRASCRWFAEQGAAACSQCSAIVTEVYAPAHRIDRRTHLTVLKGPPADS